MRRFRKVRHVPLPLLAVIMAAILFAELARCEREGAKETAAEAEKSVPRRAALTFDDGPNACYTPEVLEILKENEIPATFFLQGQCLAGNEEIVRRMHAEGHLIGNHGYRHPASPWPPVRSHNPEMALPWPEYAQRSGSVSPE